MRRFLLSLIAMAVLLFAVDRGVGAAMARLFRTSASEEEGDRFGRAIAAQPEVVITGSSRAMHGYVADSLGAWLGTRAYNLGRDGMWGSLYAYGAGAIVRRHARPKVWILDAMPELYVGRERFDYLSCFLPYIEQEPAAREIAAQRSRWERVRMLSHIYPYNSLLVSLLSPRLGKVVQPRDGYLELTGQMVIDSTAAASPAPDAYPRDPLKWKYLGKTIEVLEAGGVEVVAVRSPQWVAGDAGREQQRRISAELARTFGELGVRYLDFSVPDHPELADPSLYRDAEHLNGTGALRFTRELAESLQVTRWAGPVRTRQAIAK
jgi:hypothetical protein